MKRPKKRTRQDKQRIARLLKRDLKGLSDAEIDRVVEQHAKDFRL